MNAIEQLRRSPALWNREALDLNSSETLAQILDRGSIEDWRALYRLAQDGEGDAELARDLQRRLLEVLKTVPVPLPYFWLAALESISDPDAGEEPALSFPAYPSEAAL